MIATTSSSSTIVHTLGPYDILCGRCKEAYNNIGNRRLRVTVNLNLQKYLDAPSRAAKGDVVKHVVRVLTEEVGARFFKQQGDCYVTIDKKGIREKVAHAMRDMCAKHQNQLQKKKGNCHASQKGKRNNSTSSSVSQCPEFERQPSACLSSSSTTKLSRSSSSKMYMKKFEMNEESRLLKSLERDIKFDCILSKVLANAGMPSPATIPTTTTKADSLFPEDDDFMMTMPTSCFSDIDMKMVGSNDGRGAYDDIFSSSTFNF